MRIPHIPDRAFEAGSGKVQLSRDLEPEYIAVAADGNTAWVSLQENDAVAVLDVGARRFEQLLPLGVKDFSLGAPRLETFPLADAATTTCAALVSSAAIDPPRGAWLASQESLGGREVHDVLSGKSIERCVLERGRVSCTPRLSLPRAALAWDARGLVRDARDGSYWLGDGRRPVLRQLDAEGRLVASVDLALMVGERAVIDALAFDAERRHLLALVHVEAGVVAAGRRTELTRIIVLDVAGPLAAQPRAEYLLALDGDPPPRPSAATVVPGGELLVFARASQTGGARTLALHVDVAGASDVLGRELPRGQPFEAWRVDELVADLGLALAHRRTAFELPEAGALEIAGAAPLRGGRIALVATATEAAAAGSARAHPLLGVLSFDAQNRLDASDRDGAVRLQHWPVLGGYMPDGIQALHVAGEDYFLTANEGDTRGHDAKRLADVELDPARFPAAVSLQSRSSLGRLRISAVDGDLDGDGDLDEIHTFGARSLSVWNASGVLVADTGSLFEDVTAAALGGEFNADNDENTSFDTRSDDRGPEPEGLEVAEISGRTYAFVGLERVGGIVVLDVSEPRVPVFVEYLNTRDFSGNVERGGARDLGPEGLKYVPAGESPTGRGLLLVGNEVSGTTTAYAVNL